MNRDRKEIPPTLAENPTSAIGYGLGIAFLLFLLLPLTQMISEESDRSGYEIISFELPPPPPPPPEIEPPAQEEEEQEIEELEQEQPPPTLEQLELSLSADLSSSIGGDFSIPTIDVAQDISQVIFDLSDVDQPPQIRVPIEPVYPTEMKRAGIEGRTVVIFIVDETGRVRNPAIESSTNPAFDKPSVDAIRRFAFSPAIRNGEKVKVRVRMPFDFTLNK